MKSNGFFLFFISICCSILTLPFAVMAQQATDHDTTFYKTYPHTLVGRFYFSKKYTSFTLPAAVDEKDIKYKPNTLLTIGVGATYNNLTLNLSYGFKFLNKDADEKGKTKSIDLQVHFFPDKWAMDLFAIRHKGLYLEKEDYAAANSDNYYYRPDIKQLFIGFSAYRVLNQRKFSYNAALVQNEWQKKSAGSLLLGGLAYYGQIEGDSALIPAKILNDFPQAAGIKKANFLALGIGGGYAYTLAIAKHFYLTGSAIANIDVNFSVVKKEDKNYNNTTVNPLLIYKAAIGYNSDTWDISANWAASDMWIKSDYFSDDFKIPTGNYRLILSRKIALNRH